MAKVNIAKYILFRSCWLNQPKMARLVESTWVPYDLIQTPHSHYLCI